MEVNVLGPGSSGILTPLVIQFVQKVRRHESKFRNPQVQTVQSHRVHCDPLTNRSQFIQGSVYDDHTVPVVSFRHTHPFVLFFSHSVLHLLLCKRNFFRDLNARHTWMSVAVCFHSERGRCCVRGRVRMWSFSDSNDVEDSLIFSFRPLSDASCMGSAGASRTECSKDTQTSDSVSIVYVQTKTVFPIGASQGCWSNFVATMSRANQD